MRARGGFDHRRDPRARISTTLSQPHSACAECPHSLSEWETRHTVGPSLDCRVVRVARAVRTPHVHRLSLSVCCVSTALYSVRLYSRAVSRRAGCSGPKALARAVYDYDERGPRHGSPRTRRGTRTKITLKSTYCTQNGPENRLRLKFCVDFVLVCHLVCQINSVIRSSAHSCVQYR